MVIMLWEGRALRDLRVDDIRQVIESGLEEHLQLDYKGELYSNNDEGRREFLLDICMFANASGGILLIGIPERRDENGQPTGSPDPDGALGLDLPNPEAVLAAYDASVTAAIEERLPLESASIQVEDGRRVLVIRVPNSTNKPHSVRYKGHIYFPSRRERQRYHMSVREIKELVMRTASRLEQAEQLLREAFAGVRQADGPYLEIGIVPIFFSDFLVDVQDRAVREAIANFNRAEQPEYINPSFTFNGLERREARYNYIVQFHRNGLTSSSRQLPLIANPADVREIFYINAIDVSLLRFVQKASAVYEAAEISGPHLLGMMIRSERPLTGARPAEVGGYYTTTIPEGVYCFPFMQIDELSRIDEFIRPLCDQAHQMFGQERSPSFNNEGVWIGRYA